MSERDVLRENWQRRVTQQQSSGLSAAKWCREQEVQYKSFLYWKDRLSPVPKLSRSCFQELTGAPACEVEIEYKDVKVALSGRIGPNDLVEWLRALKSC